MRTYAAFSYICFLAGVVSFMHNFAFNYELSMRYFCFFMHFIFHSNTYCQLFPTHCSFFFFLSCWGFSLCDCNNQSTYLSIYIYLSNFYLILQVICTLSSSFLHYNHCLLFLYFTMLSVFSVTIITDQPIYLYLSISNFCLILQVINIFFDRFFIIIIYYSVVSRFSSFIPFSLCPLFLSPFPPSPSSFILHR